MVKFFVSMDHKLGLPSTKMATRSVLIWDSRAGVSPMGWLSGIDICGDSLDISRDGYTLLVGLVPGVGGQGVVPLRLGILLGTWRGPSETHGICEAIYKGYNSIEN